MMCPTESVEKQRRRPWTVEEDVTLLNVTSSVKRKEWSQIARHFDGRTGEQCRQRFYSRPAKKYKKGGWTHEEDDTIIRLQGDYGNCWSKIAKYLPDRSENCIKNRWHGVLQHRLGQCPAESTAAIPPFGTDHGSDPQRPLHTPCPILPSRTSFLSEPSATEQRLLATSVGSGSPQAAMATRGSERRRAPFMPWTAEEDRSLVDAVRRLGPHEPRRRDWQSIALQVAGRSGRQCWQRYYQQLREDFRAGGWTAEEDAAIVEHQARLGNRWAAIAGHLRQRSANAVKNRWHCCLRHRRAPPAPPHDVAAAPGDGTGGIGPRAKDWDLDSGECVGSGGSSHARAGLLGSHRQGGTVGHDSDSSLARAFAGASAGRPPQRPPRAAAGWPAHGGDAAGGTGSEGEDSDSGWSLPGEPELRDPRSSSAEARQTTADGDEGGGGGDCSEGPGRARLRRWRRRRGGYGGHCDGGGGGRPGDSDSGEARGHSDNSECGSDWADSDGAAAERQPELESDSEDSAGAARGGGYGGGWGGCDVAQPWPAGGGGGGGGGTASSWSRRGVIAEDSDWAAFPGPLPPIEPAARAAVAATAAGEGACDPMALEDADWAVWLAPPPPSRSVPLAASPAAGLDWGAAPRRPMRGPARATP